MGKLQVCISFKNSQDEQDLYMFLVGQNDKSSFVKNLIRNYISQSEKEIMTNQQNNPITNPPPSISHGSRTKSKFLV